MVGTWMIWLGINKAGDERRLYFHDSMKWEAIFSYEEPSQILKIAGLGFVDWSWIMYVTVNGWFYQGYCTLPKIILSPFFKGTSFWKEISSSNHHVSGDMLVLQGVYIYRYMNQRSTHTHICIYIYMYIISIFMVIWWIDWLPRSDGNELSRRELERQIQELRRDKVRGCPGWRYGGSVDVWSAARNFVETKIMWKALVSMRYDMVWVMYEWYHVYESLWFWIFWVIKPVGNMKR